MKLSFFLLITLLMACSGPDRVGQDCFSEKETDSINRYFNFQAELDSIWDQACVLDEGLPHSISWVSSSRYKPSLDIVCDTLPEAKDIVWGKQRIFKKDATTEEILHTLIPGHLYVGVSGEGDTVAMDLWTCARCSTDSVLYFDSPDNYMTFPYGELNNTMIDTVIEREHRGKKYRFISFYHMAEFSPMGSGRFAGAPMGMLVVKQNSQHQEVVAFDPYLGTYGAFQNPVLPYLDWVDDRLFISYEFSNGGPGDPYTSYREIFLLEKDQFRLVGRCHFLNFFNSVAAEWYSKIEFISGSEFQLTIAGVISPQMIMENYAWAMEDAFDELKQWVAQHKDDLGCYTFEIKTKQQLVKGMFRDKGPHEFTIALCK